MESACSLRSLRCSAFGWRHALLVGLPAVSFALPRWPLIQLERLMAVQDGSFKAVDFEQLSTSFLRRSGATR